MTEEQNQFIGYWTGQAIAELDAGRLDEAEAAVRRVLEKFPAEKEAAVILEQIADGPRQPIPGQPPSPPPASCSTSDNGNEAITAARRILATIPDDADARPSSLTPPPLSKNKPPNKRKAEEPFGTSRRPRSRPVRPAGARLVARGRRARSGQTGDRARLEKMASYTRTLRVPGDFATPAEALAAARDRDRIVLTEQTWKGPLVINAAVDLQGAGSAKTIVECPAAEGCAITIGPDAKGARITGIAFRHESFLAVGTDRFSAALVRGGGATFVGLPLQRCQRPRPGGHRERRGDRQPLPFRGQRLERRRRHRQGLPCSKSGIPNRSDNFEHGIESWNGAAVTLVNNRCEGNSRNGIHADNGTAAATIEGNQLIANREFGLVLDSAGSGKISGNTARGKSARRLRDPHRRRQTPRHRQPGHPQPRAPASSWKKACPPRTTRETPCRRTPAPISSPEPGCPIRKNGCRLHLARLPAELVFSSNGCRLMVEPASGG